MSRVTNPILQPESAPAIPPEGGVCSCFPFGCSMALATCIPLGAVLSVLRVLPYRPGLENYGLVAILGSPAAALFLYAVLFMNASITADPHGLTFRNINSTPWSLHPMTWSFVPWEQVSTLREGVHTGRGGRYSWFRVEHPAGSLDVKSSYTNYALLLSYIRARMAEVASAKRAAAAKPPSPAEPDRDGHFAKNRPDIGAIPSASVPFTQGLELENYSAPMRFVPKTFASPAPAGAIVGSIAATPLAAFVLIIPVPPPYRPGMEFLALLVFLTSLALPRYFYSVALRKRPYAVFEVDDEGFFWGDGNDELRARWGQVTLVSRAGDVLSVKTSLGWIHLTPGNFDRPYTLRMYIRSHLPASVQVPPGTFGDVTDPVSQ